MIGPCNPWQCRDLSERRASGCSEVAVQYGVSATLVDQPEPVCPQPATWTAFGRAAGSEDVSRECSHSTTSRRGLGVSPGPTVTTDQATVVECDGGVLYPNRIRGEREQRRGASSNRRSHERGASRVLDLDRRDAGAGMEHAVFDPNDALVVLHSELTGRTAQTAERQGLAGTEVVDREVREKEGRYDTLVHHEGDAFVIDRRRSSVGAVLNEHDIAIL